MGCISAEKEFPSLETEIIIIKTKGDKILDKALDKIGDKGLFVKELEEALLGQDIDIAVHSMKDMPTAHPEGLLIAPVPQRADHRDVLIFKEGIHFFFRYPTGWCRWYGKQETMLSTGCYKT